ncbi:MAG: SHOCT domain-containing protein [Candidatus Dormibacteria bacterium]
MEASASGLTEVIAMMWGYGSGAAGWWMVVESLIWVLVVVAVIVGVLALVRGAHGNDEVSARSILEVRFARGEIDQDEFNRRVAALKTSAR